MMIIDTHAHLFAGEFHEDLDDVVTRAGAAGVKRVLLPNIDESTITDLRATVAHYPDFFLPMMGLHPTSVTGAWRQQLDTIYAELDRNDYIAVGEVGMDLYRDRSLQHEQREAFEEQLRWSIEKALPLSIHSRNATDEVVRSIRRVGESALRGVFHSFGGSKEELEAILSLKNFRVGINGVVTFKNSGLSETLIHCPADRVILETDAPYLTPAPFRGKRNESAYLSLILKKMAEIWQVSEEAAATLTSRNAAALFNIDG